MKKNLKICALFVLFAICFTMSAHAVRVGDVINYALSTDIVARINGYDIESYNVDGYTYIIAEDLSNYGFNVEWNPYNRTLSVNKNYEINYINSNYKKPYVPQSQVGKISHNILHTDIVTYVNGSWVQSYNINGRTIILFDSLGAFGNVVWNAYDRVISLSIDGLNANTSNTPSYNNFVGKWNNVFTTYLAHALDIEFKIISADDYNQTVTLSYRYDMGPGPSIWSGTSSDYCDPIRVNYHPETVKLNVGGNEFEEKTGYVTDMIQVMSDNESFEMLKGTKPQKFAQFKLAIIDNNLYYMLAPSGWTYYDSFKCSRIY